MGLQGAQRLLAIMLKSPRRLTYRVRRWQRDQGFWLDIGGGWKYCKARAATLDAFDLTRDRETSFLSSRLYALLSTIIMEKTDAL